MENEKKEIENMCLTDFVEEYEKIVSTSGNSVVIKTEWNKKGDFFQKLRCTIITIPPSKH